MALPDETLILDHADLHLLRMVDDGAITWSPELETWYDHENALTGPCTGPVADRLYALLNDALIAPTPARLPEAPLRRLVSLTDAGELVLR
jgi:hypothetical protein